MRATASSWKHLPPPDERAPLQLEATFSIEEAGRLRLGFVPQRMEDKWFIYYDDDWLRFHRSWTGAFIYAVRLDDSPAGARVVESWVSRDPQQHAVSDIDHDRRLVRFLIDAFLLGKADAKFPMPSGAQQAPDGLVQHAFVGRGYPQTDADDDASH